MAEKPSYKKIFKKPAEQHTTAAWTTKEETKQSDSPARPAVSQAASASAKEYADENEK